MPQIQQPASYRAERRAQPTLLFEPGKFFKSCHASSVLPLADGTVLCAYFAGDHEKADNVGIWLSRLSGGQWEAPVCIAKVNDTPHWNPVLFPTAQGARVVFKVGREIPDWKSHTMASTDGGKTWSAPTPYEAPNDACGPVRCKPLKLSNGWLLAPNSDETSADWTTRIDISLDDGAHFQTLAPIPLNITRPQDPNFISGKGAIQPTLWESAPGKVHAFVRTTCGFLFRSDSGDYGQSWCEAYNAGLPNNNSGIAAAFDGRAVYLVMNPVSGNWALRTPLVLLRSTDNGKTFEPFVTLADALVSEEDGKMAEFSYPACVYDPIQNALHITYTHLRRSVAYARVDL